jgi:hypothetical protein
VSLTRSFLIVVLFPAAALWAWRAAGPSRLWSVTGLGLGLILLFAAFQASPLGGNVIAAQYGYGATLAPLLLLHGLTLGLPLLVTGLVVQALAGRLSSALGLYVIGVLSAGVAWIAGYVAVILVYVQ